MTSRILNVIGSTFTILVLIVGFVLLWRRYLALQDEFLAHLKLDLEDVVGINTTPAGD